MSLLENQLEHDGGDDYLGRIRLRRARCIITGKVLADGLCIVANITKVYCFATLG